MLQLSRQTSLLLLLLLLPLLLRCCWLWILRAVRSVIASLLLLPVHVHYSAAQFARARASFDTTTPAKDVSEFRCHMIEPCARCYMHTGRRARARADGQRRAGRLGKWSARRCGVVLCCPQKRARLHRANASSCARELNLRTQAVGSASARDPIASRAREHSRRARLAAKLRVELFISSALFVSVAVASLAVARATFAQTLCRRPRRARLPAPKSSRC